jgi:hypothetical protein
VPQALLGMKNIKTPMRARKSSDSVAVETRPPDHTERRKAPNQSLANVVKSPTDRSASPKPPPMILHTQGRFESVARACSRSNVE